jgi:PAS domain S-box-containing protein
MAQMTGYSADELLRKTVADLTHPDDRDADWADVIGATRPDAPSYLAEKRLARKDGTPVWVRMNVGVVRDGGGHAVRAAAIVEDIGGRKRAEADLRASEDRFRQVVESARDFAIFMLDLDGRITSWNAGAEQVLGFTPGEAIGQSGVIIFTPEDREARAPEREMATARRDGRATDERWHIRKDGTRFWASGVMTALPGDGGGGGRGDLPIGYVKILRDETPRKLALDALQDANDAALTAGRVKDEFLATLSHELRTPLSSILLWTKILRRGAATPADRDEAIGAIESSAEAQKELIEDLLDTSRIGQGKLRIDLRDVPLVGVVRDAVTAIAPAAEAKGVVVTTDLAAETGVVRADPDRLRQVVWNLISNAVKFTAADGRVSVTLRRTAAAEVELGVADTGQGIEPEFLPHVFESFRQGDASNTRRYGGLGLGLSITKQLVELHGGTIRAESPGRGRGATFVVRLPLPRVRDRRGPVTAVAPTTAAAAPPTPLSAFRTDLLRGARILLVDDNVEALRATEQVLRGVGATVSAAGSAADALKLLAAASPPPIDLIVSDVAMPGTDGLAFVQAVRAAEAADDRPPMPAVALSAFARPEDRDLAFAAGFDRHVAKPIDLDVFFAAITELLAQK